jgi:hypothetical protein
VKDLQPVRLAYQPPASSTFLSEQTSHQQPASSTFLSEQISTSHQPNEQALDCRSSHEMQSLLSFSVFLFSRITHSDSVSLLISNHSCMDMDELELTQ